jgi:hypothetical protein
MFNSRLDLYTILLVSRRGDFALARSSPCELGLDVGLGKLEARRAAVDYDADGETVRFSIAAEYLVLQWRCG